jgi:transposase
MLKDVLGIDIAKAKFDVALLINNKSKYRKFNNNSKGFGDLNIWLKKHKASNLHACMEATGNYGEALASHLHDTGIPISVVNPARIKGFSQCELARTKTDKADAHLIARFCQAMKPDFWQPKPAHVRELQQWVRRLDSLQRMKNQETNRKGTANCFGVIESLNETIAILSQQITLAKKAIERIIVEHNDLQQKRVLLESIPGVGEATIALVLAFFGEPKDFGSAKEVSAFLGLNPRQNQSGSSVYGRTRISKTGDASLRKALYMPALVAIKHNPTIRIFAQNLLNRGKTKMAVVVAAMRKLVHIVYGVLKNGKPFDPAWECQNLAIN